MKIFLSHSTPDQDIAAALKKMIHDLFGKNVTVKYSSDQEAGGGIPPGAKWLLWINKRIKEANTTYIILTPNSVNRPWVLWESGAAAGVALACRKPSAVVPIIFGIANGDIPTPLADRQAVRGDTNEIGGLFRLLQSLNRQLDKPLEEKKLKSKVASLLPDYLKSIGKILEHSKPLGSLLGSLPQSFEASILRGYWATCYQFLTTVSNTRCHAEIVKLTDESCRCLRGETCLAPSPRTEGRKRPFCNKIDFEVANRHLVGHWKNISDTRYFGSIHLAVLPSENVLEGYYTAFGSDVRVTSGPWKWVRLDQKTIDETNLQSAVLREPAKIFELLTAWKEDDEPLNLKDIVEGGDRYGNRKGNGSRGR